MSRLWQPILSNPMRVPRINVRIRTKTFYSTINKSGLRYSIDNTPFQSAGPCSTGLFGYDSLRGPDELTKAAYDCIRQASQLVELVGKDEPNSSHLVVKRIDRLSDVLCTVLDACELLRNIHPDPKWIEAAESSFALLHNYLNKLNTNDALYSALKKARRGMSSGSQGDKVADLLLTDFEKSGIHMPVKSRNRFVALNDTIQQLGQQFSNSAFPHEQTVTFDNAYVELDGVPRRVVKSLVEETNSSNTAVVHVDSEIANLILRTARNPETRSRMFSAMNSASTGQIQTLEELLKARADLANLLEKESYAQYFLKDKMVQTPERLSRFLDNLAKSNRSPSQLEVAQLDDIRNQKYPGSRPVLTSDRLFYSQHLLSSSATKLEGLLAPYFSVGNTFEGISSILESIYGVFLQPERILPGEVWHPDVKKLSVVHLREGRIGTIYCDLYERKESEMRKYDNAAHFTVRCSRRVDDDEPLSTGYMKSINSERISYENGSKKRYQLPIVVLSTNFDKPYNGNPCLLSLPEIDTLFHEMGHAMHSMMAQTDFQHIAGTRVAMDFVEVPSILMESFSKDPSILSTFGSHYQTGEGVPVQLIEASRRVQAQTRAFDDQHQILLATLDLKYHSAVAATPQFNSTRVFEQLQSQIMPIKHLPNCAWQVQFSHLFSYGCSYYSYLWSKRWASRIFATLFEGKQRGQWREGGEIFRNEVLRHGGGRDPWIGLEAIGVVKPGEREER